MARRGRLMPITLMCSTCASLPERSASISVGSSSSAPRPLLISTAPLLLGRALPGLPDMIAGEARRPEQVGLVDGVEPLIHGANLLDILGLERSGGWSESSMCCSLARA